MRLTKVEINTSRVKSVTNKFEPKTLFLGMCAIICQPHKCCFYYAKCVRAEEAEEDSETRSARKRKHSLRVLGVVCLALSLPVSPSKTHCVSILIECTSSLSLHLVSLSPRTSTVTHLSSPARCVSTSTMFSLHPLCASKNAHTHTCVSLSSFHSLNARIFCGTLHVSFI